MERALSALVLFGALAAAACSDVAEPVAAPRVRAEIGHPQGSSLYTHCGIFKTEFDGRTWYAHPPLHDGSGNPPAGWGNPFQEGAFLRVSATQLVFRAPNGLTASFSTVPGPDPGPEACD